MNPLINLLGDLGKGSLPSAPVHVEICERLMDYWLDRGERRPKYHAQVKGTKHWDCGPSPETALNALIQTAPECFPNGRDNIIVTYLGILPR